MDKTNLAKTLVPAAAALALLASCSDQDFGYTADELKYAKNFTSIYGEIPEDKSWDLSSWANWKPIESNDGTRAISDGTATKGKLIENTHFKTGENWYNVDQGLLNWLDYQLAEGSDNRYLGSSFVLKVPDNDFAIIPIYQGNSAIMSELEIKINDYDITKIWTKSDNIEGDLNDGKGYQACGYFGGYSSYSAVDQGLVEVADNTAEGQYDVIENGKKCVYQPITTKHAASTILDAAVRAKPIIFNRNQISVTSGQEYMYLSLKNIAKCPVPKGKRGHFATVNGKDSWVTDQYELDASNKIVCNMWDANNVWTTIGDRLTSINSNGYMLALSVPWDHRPSATKLAGLLPNYNASTSGKPQALIIGCEDANGPDSDHDVNDVVFLIVGYPNIPTVVSTTEVIKKRYMCEDLGATDDFDFNDVVVDVTQTQEYELEYMPSSANKDGFFNNTSDANECAQVEITNIKPKENSLVQTAKISHVCGTLPIQVQVGNYLFPWITDPTDLSATRTELRAGGWKYDGSNWVTSEVNTPTRAAYDVKEEGWNPNEERVITGWDPTKNNIRVFVQWPNNWKKPHKEATNPTNDKTGLTGSNPYEGNNKKDFLDFIQGDRSVQSVTFPENGNVPYIIAMDPDVPWMKERKDILRDWLTNGEWDANSDYYKENVAGPGSGAYYEQDPNRAIIWTGKVGGEAFVTGVVCEKGSSEQLGAKEAIESGYNTLNIYTEPFGSSLNNRGYVGVSYIDSNGEWIRLTSADAEGYLDDADVSVGANKQTTWHCANIRLTDEQMAAIKANGFVVQSRTNALVIREINLSTTTGYTIQLTAPALDTGNSNSVMGTISAEDRRRDLSLSTDEGRIPFAKASYSANETCKLTANPSTGYRFVKWSDDNTENPRNVTANLGPITAVFEFSEPEANIDLTNAVQFRRWSSYEADAHISSPSDFSYNANSPFGDVMVTGENYADLTSSDVLVVKGDAGVILRLVFNRQSLDAKGSDFFAFVTDSDKEYTVLHNNTDGTKTILIDLAGIRRDKGYVHLNKIEKRGTGDITSMKLDKYDNTAAESAYTVLKNNWDQADGGSNLTKEMFYEWSSVANDAYVVGIGTSNRHSSVGDGVETKPDGQYCACVLGSGWNLEKQYANLSNATWLLVKTNAYSVAPRFWFNGKTLDFLGTDTRFCRIYKGNSGINHEYLVNLAAIRDASGGKSLLNAITTANGTESAKVKAVKVYGYSCENAAKWDAAMTAVNRSFDVDFKSTKMSDGNTTTANLNTATEDLFGNPDNASLYLDLESAHWMKIELPSSAETRKNLRLYFNNKNGNREEVTVSSPYIFINDNNWYVELDAIKTAFGQVQLRAIKGPQYGTSATIVSIKLDEYTAPTPTVFVQVGINIRLGSYDADFSDTNKNTNYTATDKLGKATFTTTGTFYSKNSDNTYSAISEKSAQLGNDEYVYVEPNTQVSISITKNEDYYGIKEANRFSDYTRPSESVGDPENGKYIPWVYYYEKEDPKLQITSDNPLVINYSNRSGTITWSSAHNGDLKYGKGGEYDYANEVNIWRNQDGTLHVAPHKDCEKVVTLWQEATERYKYAEVKQTIKIENFKNENGYYVAIGNDDNNAVSYADIKAALGFTSDTPEKNVKFVVTRETGLYTMTIGSNLNNVNIPILSKDGNGNNVWSSKVTWMNGDLRTMFSFVIAKDKVLDSNPIFFKAKDTGGSKFTKFHVQVSETDDPATENN